MHSVLLFSYAASVAQPGAAASANITIDWSTTLATTRTTPSCQVCCRRRRLPCCKLLLTLSLQVQVVVEPSMWPNSPIRETQLHWLQQLGVEASPVFWQSWFVYPHSGVAQLQPGKWDFSQITPLLRDMLNATQGRELAFQFGTVPDWMLTGPAGQRRWDFGEGMWNDTLVWDYRQSGTTWKNISQVGEYFANFISYYTAGGFTDAGAGKWYEGFHWDIPWFEFLNEMEYSQSPQLFTQESDIVTTAVAAIAPQMKFLGLVRLAMLVLTYRCCCCS